MVWVGHDGIESYGEETRIEAVINNFIEARKKDIDEIHTDLHEIIGTAPVEDSPSVGVLSR